jgi:hypothetical protein
MRRPGQNPPAGPAILAHLVQGVVSGAVGAREPAKQKRQGLPPPVVERRKRGFEDLGIWHPGCERRPPLAEHPAPYRAWRKSLSSRASSRCCRPVKPDPAQAAAGIDEDTCVSLSPAVSVSPLALVFSVPRSLSEGDCGTHGCARPRLRGRAPAATARRRGSPQRRRQRPRWRRPPLARPCSSPLLQGYRVYRSLGKPLHVF